ncbi:AGAP011605-PA, partial [Anopheles gambiae str. PEST]
MMLRTVVLCALLLLSTEYPGANGQRRYGQQDNGGLDEDQARGYGYRQGQQGALAGVGAGFGYNPYYGTQQQQYGLGAQPNLFEVVTKNTAAVFDSVNKQIGQTFNAVSRPFGAGFGFLPGMFMPGSG